MRKEFLRISNSRGEFQTARSQFSISYFFNDELQISLVLLLAKILICFSQLELNVQVLNLSIFKRNMLEIRSQ